MIPIQDNIFFKKKKTSFYTLGTTKYLYKEKFSETIRLIFYSFFVCLLSFDGLYFYVSKRPLSSSGWRARRFALFNLGRASL